MAERPNIDKLLSSPAFQQSPLEVQIQILTDQSPAFAALPSQEVKAQTLQNLLSRSQQPEMRPLAPEQPQPVSQMGPPLPKPQERSTMDMFVPQDRLGRERQLRQVLTQGVGPALGLAALTVGTGGASAPVTLPAIGAALAAGGLGAAAGSVGADIMGFDPSGSMTESATRAAKEGLFDVSAGAAGFAAGPVVRAATRKIHGLPSQLTHLSQRYGISASVEDVTHRSFVKRTRNVVGRFPLVSRPFQAANKMKAAAVKKAQGELLDEIAPVSSTSSISRNMVKNAGGLWSGFRKEVNKRYNLFREAARNADFHVDPSILQSRAREVIRSLDNLPESLRSEKVVKIVQDMGAIDQPMSYRKWEVIHNKLDDQATALFKLGKNDDAINVLSLRDAMDHDLSASIGRIDDQVATAINKTVKRLHRRADSFFHGGLELFESPTGQKFGKANKNIFRLGFEKQGTRNVDEMMDHVLNMDSPQAMNDLRRIVGGETFTKAVRVRVGNAFSSAIQVIQEGKKSGQVRINANKLADDLGLFSPKSSRRRALSVGLSKSGITVKDIEDFAEALIKVSDSEVINVSDFIARRGMLGGLRSVVRTVTPGSAPGAITGEHPVKEIGLAIVKASAFFITMGRAGNFLANPARLKWATQAMDESLTPGIRRAAAIRLSRSLENDFGDTMGGMAVAPFLPGTTKLGRLRSPALIGLGQLLDRGINPPEKLQGEEQ